MFLLIAVLAFAQPLSFLRLSRTVSAHRYW
jgi:hypothetical protein